MSNVTWCDPGEHAFKKDAPGSVHFEGKRAGESGAIESVTTDACAIHNPFPVVKPNATSQLTIDSTFELNGGVVD